MQSPDILSQIIGQFLREHVLVGESLVDVNQRRLDKRMARNKKIAKEIRHSIAGKFDTPVRLDEEIEKAAFRVLEKNSPKSLFNIFKRRRRKDDKT